MFSFSNPRHLAGAIAVISILISLPAWAQKQGAPSAPQIGSENTVMADPAVPRPNAQPCIVQLFTNLDFANYTSEVLSLHASCRSSQSLGERSCSMPIGR